MQELQVKAPRLLVLLMLLLLLMMMMLMLQLLALRLTWQCLRAQSCTPSGQMRH
jgi:hypothetical protein